MNILFAIAAGLMVLLGAVHSVIGEKLIFRSMRQNRHRKNAVLPLRHERILWVSWHLVTLFGWGMGAVILWLAFAGGQNLTSGPLENIIAVSTFLGAILVLAGTRGKHPGWVVLLVIAGLVFMG